MKTFRIIGLAIVAIFLCLSSCSGEGDDPIEPTPKPEVIKSEITIDSSIITNGLSFTNEKGEQTISFSTNENWTLSVASTTSGATWCTASATSGTKGSATVKLSVAENTSYVNRTISITIKSGTASKTFTVSQKGVDALLVTTDKYEIAQEGGSINIEVKANISYKMEISEKAKDWIAESSSRGLTSYKHTLNIAMNEENEKREGEVYFKSGDKVETVKIYQAGGAILLLSENEYQVSDKGDTISVDIRSNIDFGVQMPDVDWIVDEATSRGLSSHTLKYIVSANEGYDSRSASIVFYDKNSELKDMLIINQAQKDAIVISKKTYDVKAEGETIEVKLSANVDFEVAMPDVDWIKQVSSRALKEHTLYFNVAENNGEENRQAEIVFTNKESQLNETLIINQACLTSDIDRVVTIITDGTLKELLGDNWLNINSLKVIGPINGDDVRTLRQMLGAKGNGKSGMLTTLDLSEASIVEGGGYYYESYYTWNDVIGDFMFYECANLQKIVLPKNVTSIGKYAFFGYYNSSLTSITIGNAVTSIGESAFDGQYLLKFVYITDLSAWCNIAFNGPWANPLNYGAKLYLNNQEQIELVIPEDITKIKPYAFYGYSSMTSIEIPNAVTSIGYGAFGDCSSLSSVEIPDAVTSIGGYAFNNCTSLANVKIGNGVTLIDYGTFRRCSSLVSITIGNGVVSIGDDAFWDCSSLTSVKIPETVTSIGSGAFKECSSLTSVKIPDSVTSIGSDAFSGCSSLASITIGKGVMSIGDDAFWNCSSLTSVKIPDSVTSIGSGAFKDCSSLASISTGKKVMSIGGDAFENCSSIESVYIKDLSAWCNITFDSDDSNPLYNGAKLYLNNNELKELIIPTDITIIKNYAFYGCENITKVTMGDNVKYINFSAFRSCSSLANVTIGNGATSINSGAFKDCSSLTILTIGNGVTSMRNDAFENCSSLESIYITDLSVWCNITFDSDNSNPLYNGAKLYLNNNELKELNIPANIMKIKDYTFYGCESITKVTMGDNVKNICTAAFRGCSALTTVTIPASVTSIGKEAFYRCNSLAKVYCHVVTPLAINTTSNYLAFSSSGNKTLYVPSGCKSKYESSNWNKYFTSIVEME